MEKEGLEESWPPMLRRSRWEAVRSFAPNLDVHVARFKGVRV